MNQTAKHDAGKPRPTLVPPKIIWAITKTREFGCAKYSDPDNWKRVEPQRYRDAAYRHWLAYLEDVDSIDEESGLPSLWHLLTDIGFLVALEWDRHDKAMRKSREIKSAMTSSTTNVVVGDPDTVVSANPYVVAGHKDPVGPLGDKGVEMDNYKNCPHCGISDALAYDYVNKRYFCASCGWEGKCEQT